MKLKQFVTQLLISLTIGTLLLNSIVTPVIAQEAPPPPPPAPEAPTPPTPPAPPVPPSPLDQPPPPPEPTPPPAPPPPTEPSAPPSPILVSQPQPSPVTQSTAPAKPPSTNDSISTSASDDSTVSDNQSSTPQTLGETTGNQDASHGRGDPYINTGTASADAILTNDTNSNLAGNGSSSSGDINVGNSGNGTSSTNSADVNTTNNSSTVQTNDADINNEANLAAISGHNDTSYNTGVDNTILTGDANTTATIINGVNTNLAGVNVVEFNIDDTHTGDLILAFPDNTSCGATICGQNGTLSAQNTGNGSDTQNDASINTTNNESTFQENSADVVNDLILVADSGHNDASYNTGGDSSITTGDANVVATVGNFVNNNIAGAGEVLVAVVNIFGDLIGNILVPESTLTANGGTTAVNSSNGSNSVNNTDVTSANTANTNQTNTANITNNLNVDANTGNNSAENNTGGFANGDNVIQTGDASLDVNVINIANSNVAGDVWWLVFVNDTSGNWVGRIVGAPEGATMAGSSGTEFIVTPDGTILAQNNNNGSDSTNNSSVTTTNTSNTTQTNDANITNNLSLTANSGSNDASYNTGGSSAVNTGNANIMANIMNFVNNNIAGGKVVVSVINVFGSWLGSFVPAGEEAPSLPQVGGANTNSQSASSTNQNTNSSSGSSSNSDASNDTASTLTTTPYGNVLGVSGSKKASLNFGQVADETTGGGGTHLPPGSIVEDNTIQVPGKVKTAGAKTEIPSWFWQIFAFGIALVLLKVLVRRIKIRKLRPAAI